jgi:hypothetical protein
MKDEMDTTFYRRVVSLTGDFSAKIESDIA